MMEIYWRLLRTLAPALRTSHEEYCTRVRNAATETTWLDIGCGQYVFGDWLGREETEAVAHCRAIYGIDLDGTAIKKNRAIAKKSIADATLMPFPDGTFDLITANMVMEHVLEPPALLLEVRRVLKPGGRFIFLTPNTFGYNTVLARSLPTSFKRRLVPIIEGSRRAEDVYPAYYRFNSTGAIRRGTKAAGFELQALEPVCTVAVTGFLGPLSVFELLFIRVLQTRPFAPYRSCIIATLRKPTPDAESAP